MNKSFTITILLLFVLIAGCSSTTIISSDPNGATLYIDGMKVGKTPYTYTDSKIVGSRTPLKFAKEGYKDLQVILSKDEKADVGAIIGGVFVLVPFLWTMEYNPMHNYELEPNL